MKCCFLQEARARYCRAAAIRKMIAAGNPAVEGKCASPGHASCPVFVRNKRFVAEDGASCPFLTDTSVQYCAASPAAKFVPASESSLMRCGTSSHRYCDVFLGLVDAAQEAADPVVNGLLVPERLWYTANHFWVDPGDDGQSHVGLDAFAARLLSPVERVSFLTSGNAGRPAVVLTVRGIDFQMVFPGPMKVRDTNVRLRATPERIAEAPYTSGWLFAGDAPMPQAATGGPEAARWMREELDRLNRWGHELLFELQTATAADGGEVVPDLIACLDRDATLLLFNEFFSPFSGNGMHVE